VPSIPLKGSDNLSVLVWRARHDEMRWFTRTGGEGGVRGVAYNGLLTTLSYRG
jgi:hypothetical protein